MATGQLTGGGGLQVRVLTPQGAVTQVETDAITAPGQGGEFEVLPGHIPFLTEMHPGVLILGESQRTYFAVGPGYLRVGGKGDVEVLVERAVAGADVDVASAAEEVKATAPKLKVWKGELDAEYRTLKARHDWAEAQVNAHAAASS